MAAGESAMLIEFSVSNFGCIGPEVTLSFCSADGIADHPEQIMEAGGLRLLPLSVVYGKESSGKTTVIHALRKMKEMVLNPDGKVSAPCCCGMENEIQEFSVKIVHNSTRYFYGFSIQNRKVVSEYLYQRKMEGRQEAVFEREGDQIRMVGQLKQSPAANQLLLPEFRNRYFLPAVREVCAFFEDDLLFYDRYEQGQSAKRLGQEENLREGVSRFLRESGMAIKVKSAGSDESDENKQVVCEYGDIAVPLNQVSRTDLYRITLAECILYSCTSGKVLIVDDLDEEKDGEWIRNFVHGFLVNCSDKNAQMLFTLQNLNAVKKMNIRSDELWFVKIQKPGQPVTLFSPMDYPGLEGRWTAVRSLLPDLYDPEAAENRRKRIREQMEEYK